MTIPKHKRITVNSVDALQQQLRNPLPQTVMFVTHTQPDHAEYVERDAVEEALTAAGWSVGPRYTLTKHLLGNLATRVG